MNDPLSEVITLLQPRAVFSRRISGADRWGVRFTRTVGLPPMEYLLAWRMAVAKDLFRREDLSLAKVAERVGYGSASTFSTAFSRHVGRAPGRYARERRREATSP
jgi:AraC-like DNA-binding protein